MTNTKQVKTRSRPNNEYVLYSYGEPVGMMNDSGTSYFGTDILGSVRSVTDKYGAEQSSYDYDAFGSPYLGNLDNGMSFGYTGKAYDAGTGLYDYGFRDYSPVSARFTTIDPIRDGSNWFSYCMNDAVNYYDPDGLKVYNKTDYYILIKLEIDSGYVILAPHSTYDGKNVSGYPYQNGQKEIDSGKVDGIEISKGIPLVDRDNPNGTLYKINDKEEIPGCTSITIKQTKKGVTAKASFGSKIRNAAGNIFKDPTKEPSRYYGIQDGSKTGDWFQVSLPQETLGERLGNQKNCYVRKDELEQMQQNEINKQTETAKSRPITEKQSTNYANPQYFSENNNSASSANNVTFKNINFDGSGSVYIGFNGFSMGCSK